MSNLQAAASRHPEKPAVVMAETGDRLSYATLHARSARLARRLADRLAQGEVIAVLLGNRSEYVEVCFGARRAGLYYVPVGTHLTAGEVSYILRDSGAKLLFTESRHAPLLAAVDADVRQSIEVVDVDMDVAGQGSSDPANYRYMVDDGIIPALPDRAMGLDFAYSSGTTGKPKGIKHALTGDRQLEQSTRSAGWVAFFNLNDDSVYLSPAPLYHAAPLRFSLRCVANGGTVVVLRKFDPAAALAAIATHRVTHSQWVPTMFIRLLGLPQAVREAHDLSSHRMALHAAAPCPVDIKHRMLGWWGPIVWEYYTGSERAGATVISPQEWQCKPGSVGKAVQGTLYIVDDVGVPQAAGAEGLVCFEGGPRFQYHNDPAKTAEAHTAQGWATFGDIGRVDADGYLYLTDRRANMIISGGVNIYPQEAENALLEHPLVRDAAVIGVPHPEFGEEVKAVIELHDPQAASPEIALQLISHCRARLSAIKCPRSVDFATDLPRTETGKLLKRLVRDQYRAAAAAAQTGR
jgi:long-chain acyl-CoA synthetase